METIKKEDFREISKILKQEFSDYLGTEEDFYKELGESKINSDISRKVLDSNGNIVELLLFTDLNIYEETGILVLDNYISTKGIYLLWIDKSRRGQGNARKWLDYIKSLGTNFWIPVLNDLNTHNLWINKLGAKWILETNNCKYYHYESTSN